MDLLFTLLWWWLVTLLVIYVLSFVFEPLQYVLYKQKLVFKGIAHLFFSTDKKWRKLADPADVKRLKKKRLILVRHGESAWNVVFNRGFGPSFLVRLFRAVFEECRLLPTLDSEFFDSPLSATGGKQAQDLQKFVETHPVLSGKEGRSLIVSSNLRRALSTGTIGFWQRLNRSGEKVKILSTLQEVTFNVDGVALAKPETAPVLADEELRALKVRRSEFKPEKFYDASENAGDKSVRSRGITRMLDFARWVFTRSEDTIIVNGHSLYFRFFFQTFLPFSSNHEGKLNKMANCAVVQLDLYEGENGAFVIDEQSIVPLHRDFEAKKKKK